MGVHSIPLSSPLFCCKAQPPLGAHRPCRHNHRTATIGSQKLALIYSEPWDGLRLSVHQSVRGSRLDRVPRQQPSDQKLLTQSWSPTPISDWSEVASSEAPLLFDQLIDLLTLAAGRVSLNLISEFISGRCVYRNDVESHNQSEGWECGGREVHRFLFTAILWFERHFWQVRFFCYCSLFGSTLKSSHLYFRINTYCYFQLHRIVLPFGLIESRYFSDVVLV